MVSLSYRQGHWGRADCELGRGDYCPLPGSLVAGLRAEEVERVGRAGMLRGRRKEFAVVLMGQGKMKDDTQTFCLDSWVDGVPSFCDAEPAGTVSPEMKRLFSLILTFL